MKALPKFIGVAIIVLFLLMETAYAQQTTISCPTNNNLEGFEVTTITPSTTILRLFGDGGLYVWGAYGTGLIPLEGVGARMMWYPAKAAFRTGYEFAHQWDDVAIGNYSTAMGYGPRASGIYSTAMGDSTTASGLTSTAMGDNTTASGNYSTAMGLVTTASGNISTAIGYFTTASGEASTAMGLSTKAIGRSSTAMGDSSIASGYGSFASGFRDTASAPFSTANGYDATASGYASSAMGYRTTASGNSSIAMGYTTTASGNYSTAMGHSATASADYSTVMGSGTTASGMNSTAMGAGTIASGFSSTAMGTNTTANGDLSTAMGASVSTNAKFGAFIIGDYSTTTTTNSSAINEMTMRFAGGYRLFSNSALTTGAYMNSGASAWSYYCDRNKKENFRPVDGEQLLLNIRTLPITQWNYKGTDASIKYIGPVAQDFYSAFHLGGNDSLGINSLCIDGVNIAAIQALEKRTAELNTALNELKAEKEKVAVIEKQNIKRDKTISALSEKIEKLAQLLSSSTQINQSEFTINQTKD